MLPVTLPALLGQEYPGTLTVIVVDDGSSDGTGEVAAKLGAGSPRPLRVISGAPPPDAERWAGKVWAMAQGLRAAGPFAPGADGYLLFTDADIAWQTHTRSEEHTSELQSRLHLVCRLLLEKKKKQKHTDTLHKFTTIDMPEPPRDHPAAL